MSEIRTNPHRSESKIGKMFDYMQTKGTFNIEDLRQHGKELGFAETEISAILNALMSPRLTSERGDCRGNIAIAGHLYFLAKQPKKEVDGVKQKHCSFEFNWREVALEPRRQSRKGAKASDKVEAASDKPVATADVAEAAVA